MNNNNSRFSTANSIRSTPDSTRSMAYLTATDNNIFYMQLSLPCTFLGILSRLTLWFVWTSKRQNIKGVSMFNFIKVLTPKFSQHIAKEWWVFKVQFHNTNLALKMPRWATITPKRATKMLKLATCCLIFAAEKEAF